VHHATPAKGERPKTKWPDPREHWSLVLGLWSANRRYTVSNYSIEELIARWKKEEVTVEQVIGRMLQLLRSHEQRLRALGRQPADRNDATAKSLSEKPPLRYALRATQNTVFRVLSRPQAVSKGARPIVIRIGTKERKHG
jgi:hypothetical protein